MEVKDLENIANREKIYIVNYNMKKNKARIIDNCIFMDYSKIHSSTDEKCTLAEELGHYYYDAYYTLNSSQTDIDRAEYKANKWAFKTLIPLQKLEELFNKGYTHYYEFAEELGVTEDFVKKAYEYYKAN